MALNPLRGLINLIEAMTAFDEYIDPEDVIDYPGLLVFAEDFAEHGPPPMPHMLMRNTLGADGGEQSFPGLPLQTVLRALLAPQHRFLDRVQSGMNLLMNAKHLSAAEQDRLLQRFEEGHTIWRWHRLNINPWELMAVCKGRPSHAEGNPSPERGDEVILASGDTVASVHAIYGVESDNSTYDVELDREVDGSTRAYVRWKRTLGGRNQWAFVS